MRSCDAVCQPRLRVLACMALTDVFSWSASNRQLEVRLQYIRPHACCCSQQDHGLDSTTVGELQRTMRGMDNARLLTLTGLLPDGADGTGEEAYDPGGDQAVLLLAVKVDGKPSIGADLVDCQLREDGTVRLSTPGLEGLYD